MNLFLVAARDIEYSEALGNMIVGILVVFCALLFLCGVISLFKFLGKASKNEPKAAQKAPVKTAAPAPAKAPTPAEASGEDDAVIAAILAAVAQQCGPNAKVTSIQRAQ